MKTKFHYFPQMLLTLLLFGTASSHAIGETTRASIDSAGAELKGSSVFSSLSADGRFVAFTSSDNSGTAVVLNVFVHDRWTGKTTSASVDSENNAGNDSSYYPSISADGRYVAFTSIATNLVPGDTNATWDVFVHDRVKGATERVSVDSDGHQVINASVNPVISADGRYVAFTSIADTLVPGDSNEDWDVFVHDRASGKTTRASVDSAGLEATSNSSIWPSISADGRFVAFTSRAPNLVLKDSNGVDDIFVHDRLNGITTRVSVASDKRQADRSSYRPFLSANGRYVAFTSNASTLVADDVNGRPDVFVHDRLNATTTRISLDGLGKELTHASSATAISADGLYIAFASASPDIVPGDTNRRMDAFVANRLSGKISRVSVASNGLESNAGISLPSDYGFSISADGRYTTFDSIADNLVEDDTNAQDDVFVRDRLLNASRHTDLQITVAYQPASVERGENAQYVFTITNNGPANATFVTLIDNISGGSIKRLIPVQGGHCSIAALSVCRLPQLATGASTTVRSVIKAQNKVLTQRLSVSSAPVENVIANNRITVSTSVMP